MRPGEAELAARRCRLKKPRRPKARCPVRRCICRRRGMPLFTWSPSYSVKVKRFDDDHQQLFSIINELHEGMSKGRGKEILHDVLTRLLRYTERHFTAEEAVM